MNARLHQAELLLARLSPREQRLVGAFAGLVALMLAWTFVLSPFLYGRDRVRSEIEGLRGELAQMSVLALQIRQTDSESSKPRTAEPLPSDFSVLAFVEKAAGASLRPESIASMTPSRRPLDGGRTESNVELKISAASLGEVVAMLQGIEGENSGVYIKQFFVKKRYDDASLFDATVVVAATLPA